jgi:hypothetical protein
MILTFRDGEAREAECLSSRLPSRKLPGNIQRAALRKLRMLNRAASLADLSAAERATFGELSLLRPRVAMKSNAGASAGERYAFLWKDLRRLMGAAGIGDDENLVVYPLTELAQPAHASTMIPSFRGISRRHISAVLR